MTPQEIFDTVAKHLFEQGKQATDESGSCMYRAPDGAKCAVGCLISDDLYTENIEGCDLEGLVRACGFVAPKWMKQNGHLLSDLQQIHDHDSFWDDAETLRSELAKAANKHDLSPSALNGLHFPTQTGEA